MVVAAIQRMTISHGRLELLLADAATAEEATVAVQISVAHTVERNRSLAEAELEALRTARTAIDAEIQAISNLAGRKP
ncbi:MAG TPA: hypothetical protein VN821_12445 [Candidatus Udaeobacter sp.]|nr:hypothetical protein [Candidatus Udaeobacter sp.]